MSEEKTLAGGLGGNLEIQYCMYILVCVMVLPVNGGGGGGILWEGLSPA